MSPEGKVARVLLEGGAMNAHFFGTKRAFHAILRITRKPLASFGLTAARYDMLYAICSRAPELDSHECPVEQSELREKLGVHKSVVSRMLRSLEQLGLVSRERSYGDRRRLRVRLTDAGVARLADAIRCLARASRRLLCMAICFGRWRDPDERFRHMEAYESYLRVIRRNYGDAAWLAYRWHPEDLAYGQVWLAQEENCDAHFVVAHD
jgi:DNA-binding MarR family transcriptional regulator